ncbi:MAG: hypothetical protein ABH829_05640 [archaeon]
MKPKLTRESSNEDFRQDYLLWRKQPLDEELAKFESILKGWESKRAEAEKEIAWYSNQANIIKEVLAQK